MEYQGVVILCLDALNQHEEERQLKPLALPEWRLYLCPKLSRKFLGSFPIYSLLSILTKGAEDNE